MKVRLLISRAGADFVQHVGDEITVPDDEGKRMIAAGQAVPIAATGKETASKKATAQRAVKE
jgi:hypothetical protein